MAQCLHNKFIIVPVVALVCPSHCTTEFPKFFFSKNRYKTVLCVWNNKYYYYRIFYVVKTTINIILRLLLRFLTKLLRFSVFFHVEYCLKMFYQFLKLILNVKILRSKNIFCVKTIIYDSKSWIFYFYAFFVLKIFFFYL